MPEGQVLEFSGVTKRFGAVDAVSDFTARVTPGLVTGFLGPNGAGKTTSLRILLGLVRPTSGRTTIGGVPYAKLPQPLQTVGAVLEASSFHPGRTAANHLRVYARAAKISDARVDEVLGLVGLSDAAGRKVGGFSLGMRQRLGLAYALLGDPGVLVLDEPANGLDPEGIRWMRGFLRQLASEGRTVLVSSHLLTEVQQTVDALLIISQGRLVFEGGLDELADPSEYATIVDAPDRAALVAALAAADVSYEVLRSGVTVRTLTPAEIGVIAADAGVALSSLQRKGPALEEVFLELVSGARVHSSAPHAAAEVAPPLVVAVAETRPPVVDEEVLPIVEEPAVVVDDVEEPDVEEPAAPPVAPVAAGVSAPVAAPVSAPVAATGATFATSSDGLTEATGAITIIPADLETPHAFAVAATGVIDVVPPSTEWDPAEPPAEPDPSPPDEPAPHGQDASVPAGDPVPEGFAADGVFPEQDPVAPIDADVDVESLGEIDEELSTPDGGDGAADDRPFDNYDKTEADVEADAFFSAFDESQRRAAREADAASQPVASTVDDQAEGESVDPERALETEEFGSLVDYRPEESDTNDDHHDDSEGGEQR